MVDAEDVDLSDSPDTKLSDLRGWLRPTPYWNASSDFKKHLNAHVPGTGRWLFETPEYQQWHDSTTQGILWLKAVAGAGKSVLAAHLISDLQAKEEKKPVLFFFARRIVTANHGCQSLVRDCMHQLLGHSPELRARLEAVKKTNSDVENVAFNELWQVFLDALNTVEKAYCIQKALNVPSILQLRLEDRQVNKDIALFLECRLSHASHLSVPAKEKVKRLIEDRVHPSFLYARLMLDELLEEHRVESLGVDRVRNALLSLPASLEHMYTQMLHGHSQLASVPQERQVLILQLATHASRPLRLLEISTVLNFLDMAQTKSTHGDTKNMTRMSCGPLLEILEDETVSIIHHSFTEFLTDMQRKGQSLTQNGAPTFPVIDSSATHELMALICVRYLLSGCLSSWTLKARAQRHTIMMGATVEQKESQLQHPFLAYALQNWCYHIRQVSEVKGELLDALDQLMQPGTTVFLGCVDYMLQPVYNVETITPLHLAAWGGMTAYIKKRLMSDSSLDAITEFAETSLSMAAQRGHDGTASLLLNHGAAPDTPDKRGMKPLHYAARSNHHATVQVLLDAGVNPMTRRTQDYSLSENSYVSTTGDTALEYASESGCVESIAAMIPCLSQEDLNSYLIFAITRGHVLAVKYVLQTGLVDVKSSIGGQALIEAGSDLNFQILELLLSKGADPLYQQQPSHIAYANVIVIEHEPVIEKTSLILAVCGSPHMESGITNHEPRCHMFERCLNLAISAGSDVNVQGEEGYTALHYCIVRCIPGTESLLEHGAKTDARDLNDNTPLHLLRPFPALERTLDSLIRSGAQWDAVREKDGKTALHACLENWSGDIAWMRPYVKDWGTADYEGNTPLHVVSKRGGPGIKELIEMGADIDSKNHQGATPLLEMEDDMYEKDYAGDNALHLTCQYSRRAGAIKFLLDVGADPLHRNHMGDTLYHVLARRASRRPSDGTFEEILNLIRNTAIPIRAKNFRGETLLHVLCSKNRKRARTVVDSLPQSDVDAMFKMTDNEGKTPTHNAVAYCQRMAEWVVRKAPDLTIRTHQRQNLLHLAAEAGQSNVIGLLLESYSKVQRDKVMNQVDRDERTPLHYACCSGRPESVQLLLDAGADVRVADKNGYTPLHACAMFVRHSGVLDANKYPETRISSDKETLRVTDIVHLLCRHGADIQAKNRFRRTPIEVALDNNHEEMIYALTREMAEASSRLLSQADLYRGVSGQTYFSSRQTNVESLIQELKETEYLERTLIQVLRSGAYGALEEVAIRGAEFTAENIHWKQFLIYLAEWGYADLLERLLKRERDIDWINESLSIPHDWRKTERPVLFFVASRELPSLPLLRLLVETFDADVNVRSTTNEDFSGTSILHILAKGEHWWQTDAVRYVLDKGADVTMQDGRDRRTALHVAMSAVPRRIGILKALLEHGANPNTADKDGVTPFNLTTGDPELFRLFLRYGADVTTGNEPMLFRAIQNLNVDLVQEILMAGVDCNMPFKNGLTTPDLEKHRRSMGNEAAENHYSLSLPPIRFAARLWFPRVEDLAKHQKALRIVEILLGHGATPFSPLENTTILHDVIDYGGTLEPLLALPALDLEQRDIKERTLLLAACGGRDPGETPFNRHLGRYRIELIRKLCAMGADVSAVDSHKRNVLHLLVTTMKEAKDQIEFTGLIKELIMKRPDLLQERNEEGYTPLLLAAVKKRVPTTAILAEAGANFQECDSDGNTMLHHVASFYCSLSSEHDIAAAYTLMRLGLDFNARNNDGDAPISKYVLSFNDQPQTWVDNPYVEQLKSFREYGADYHTVNNAGETLLHLAARIPWHEETDADDKSVRAFKCLMDMGLNPLQEDHQQRTPLDVAAAYGKDDIVALFQKR
ncbi:ankyrin [Aspergillus steynii IBT 23096]|uniref:Ankyrin n=1 Tax=Aspergillus steynii IBT 23096 TaxID=1392250 RepID=A0A2I2FTZ4_9EURO|nr:ankyrin [Aspergillus steynii IBT 23096]PLB44109.1 ankyrin [Aspergillus steynii IBT 23096]